MVREVSFYSYRTSLVFYVELFSALIIQSRGKSISVEARLGHVAAKINSSSHGVALIQRIKHRWLL